MPSITSSLVSTWRPISIRSTTVRPSRAASRTQSVRIAIASGWFSSTGLASASNVGCHVDQQSLLFMW